MQFRTVFKSSPAPFLLEHSHHIMFLGSCFSESIFQKIQQGGFKNTQSNPFGVLFNAKSIQQILYKTIHQKQYKPTDFFENQGVFRSWDFGLQMSRTSLEETLHHCNQTVENTYTFLQQTDYIFITLGTSWVYETLEDSKIVANCHKMPAAIFQKRLLGIPETTQILKELITDLQRFNPNIQIVFTISPVRHLKDGFIENQRSKAILIESVHQITEEQNAVHYFPSYELLMDDLREYRFYSDDLLHPNNQAIQYIWEHFIQTYFSPKTVEIVAEVEKIYGMQQHLPFNTNTVEYQKFVENLATKKANLKQFYGIDV